MQRRDINAPDAPPPADQYTQAVDVTGTTRTLYISGQVGVAADGSVPRTPRRKAHCRGETSRRNCAPPTWGSRTW